MKNNFSKITIIVALAICIICSSAFNQVMADNIPSLKYTSKIIYLCGDSTRIYVDNCRIPCQDADGYKITYKVTKGGSLITVDKNGKVQVTGKGVGTAVVRVTFTKLEQEDITSDFTVKIMRNAADIRLSSASLKRLGERLKIGDTITLSAEKSYDGSYAAGHFGKDNYTGVVTDTLKLESLTPEIATADGMKITIKSAGTVQFVIKAYQNSGKTYTGIQSDIYSIDIKIYTIDTVAKTNVMDYYNYSSADMEKFLYTMDDDNNIYYVDRNVNKVVMTNIYTKETEDIIDISSIKYESDAVDYWDFKISNLYYDNYSGKLLAEGHYNKMNGNGEDMEGTYELPSLELITDKSYSGRIIGTLNNGNYVTFGGQTNFYGSYLYTLYRMDRDFNTSEIVSQGLGSVLSVEQIGTDLYFVVPWYCVYKYDYSSLERLFDIKGGSTAVKNEKVYEILFDCIRIYNLYGKRLEDITAKDIQVLDMTPVAFGNVGENIFITQNEDIVYYDRNAGAFRIISKNN